MFRGDEAMPLTSGEFAVLKALVTNAREPMSRDKLMNMARGREYSAMERSIDVQISRLRRMLEETQASHATSKRYGLRLCVRSRWQISVITFKVCR